MVPKIYRDLSALGVCGSVQQSLDPKNYRINCRGQKIAQGTPNKMINHHMFKRFVIWPHLHVYILTVRLTVDTR